MAYLFDSFEGWKKYCLDNKFSLAETVQEYEHEQKGRSAQEVSEESISLSESGALRRISTADFTGPCCQGSKLVHGPCGGCPHGRCEWHYAGCSVYVARDSSPRLPENYGSHYGSSRDRH